MPAECCKKFWNRIEENVPVFTLVGYDKLAIRTVRFWIAEAAKEGVNFAKLDLAMRHLHGMESYTEQFPERMKMPD